MRIIIEKLDILNIIKKLYKDEKLQENIYIQNEIIIEMSDECKKNLNDINK